jgi:hypothetical protein
VPYFLDEGNRREREGRCEALAVTDEGQKKKIIELWAYVDVLYNALTLKGNKLSQLYNTKTGQNDSEFVDAFEHESTRVWHWLDPTCPVDRFYYLKIQYGKEGHPQLPRLIISLDHTYVEDTEIFAIIDDYEWLIEVTSPEGEVVFSTSEWVKDRQREAAENEEGSGEEAPSPQRARAPEAKGPIGKKMRREEHEMEAPKGAKRAKKAREF